MTRRYELVYIFDSALEESQIDEALAKHHALLKDPENKEPIKETKHWGKRTLAYPIEKSEVGHYVVVDLHTDPVKLPEFERALKLDPQIIRYMVVLNEGEPPRLMVHPDDRPDSDGDGDRPRRRDDRKGDETKKTEAAKPDEKAEPAKETGEPGAEAKADEKAVPAEATAQPAAVAKADEKAEPAAEVKADEKTEPAEVTDKPEAEAKADEKSEPADAPDDEKKGDDQ